jgi:dTDP-4-amino-4,6-dideoxygalactose transaminase
MSWQVPLFDTDMEQGELDAVSQVLRSGWLTMGEEIKSFEREFAEFLGVKHAVMVSNCSTALHLAHYVLGAGPGDEVLCPSLSFVATASSIVQTGAQPVFADVTSLDNLTVSPAELERRITPRTKGLVVMHYAGYPCDMESVMALARSRNLYVVEDCAHSPGASSPQGMTGTIGDVGCFSFFSNKNLSTGEGGMVVTNRDDLADRMRLLRSHGMTTVTLDRHKGHAFSYDVAECGFNYRSCEINAAIGRVQLGKLAAKNRRRKALVQQYQEQFAGQDRVTPFFRNCASAGESAYHIFPVLLPEGADRNAFMTGMRELGIQTSIHYRPIHTFSAYAENFPGSALPITEEVGARLVTLPLYPTMTDGQLDQVVQGVAACLS